MFALIVLLFALSEAQMYATSNFGYIEISPVDACRGKSCKKRVSAIMKEAEHIQKDLKQLDDTDRALVKENEHDMSDMTLFNNAEEQRNLRRKIRKHTHQLRKVRRTRNTLLRRLHTVVGKLSIPQQGRLIRYLNLEDYVNVKYGDFSKKESLPKKFKTCDNNKSVMPEMD